MLRATRVSLEQESKLFSTIVGRWVATGVADATTVASLPRVMEFAAGLDEVADEPRLTAVLQSFAATQGIDMVAVFHTTDWKMVAAGASSPPADGGLACRALARKSIALNMVVIDVHRHTDGKVVVAFTAPVPGALGSPAAAVVFESSPERWLYPLLRTTSTDGTGHETLLLESTGDRRLLSPRSGEVMPSLEAYEGLELPAASLSRTSSEADAPVVYADRRGARRIAVVRRIAGAPWLLVVQAEQDRVEREIRRQLARDGLVAVSMFLAIAATVIVIVGVKERQLQRLDRRLAAVMSQANDAILFIGRGGMIYEANGRAEKLYGMTRAELCAHSLSDLGRRPSDDPSGEVLAYEESSGRRAFRAWHHDSHGRVFPVEISSRLAEIDGTEGFVVVVRDVSEAVAAEAELLRFHDELETRVTQRTAQLADANRELEAFSYSVSHDLRAPLRAIDGFAKILEQDYDSSFDDEGRRILAVVRSSAKRMGQLIDDLLEFSRAGRREIRSIPVDMNEIVAAVITELSAETPECASRFRGDELPGAMCDPMLIRQVWQNLLSNALKFSQSSPSSSVEIAARREPGRIVYSVLDHGVGFDMRYASKLFGVFQRLHSQREFEGTGVGLALVQRIVRRHGGEVWAEAVVDGGATFFFSLPDRTDGSASENVK
ncbi:MAG: PAS domain S-box protein [Acidobacteria bacterium]|nr:PAS domain S-box protein [Acidobacteriota bacterium]